MNEIYVLDRSLNLLGVIDSYVSSIWRPAYYDIGDFEIYLAATDQALELLQKDRYVVRKGDITVDEDGNVTYKKVMIVKNVQIITDVENGDFLTVTGRELKYLLNQRIVWSQTNLTGKVNEAIERLIEENAINPTDSKRVIPNLAFNSSISGKRLPDEYRELEYIESTGTQYIDTSFVPNQDSSIELGVSFAEISNKCVLFGSAQNYNSLAFESYVWDSALQINYGNNGMSYFNEITALEKFVVSLDKNIATVIYPDGATVSNEVSYSAFNTPYTLTLFATHRASVGCGVARIHSARIKDNGSLIRDFVPAKRISDGVIGLYDIVEDKFYTNAGSGTFKAGGVVGAKRLYLYKEGNECVDVTGGWVSQGLGYSSAYNVPNAPTLTKNSTNMVMSRSVNGYGCGVVIPKNKIDFTGYNTINAVVDFGGTSGNCLIQGYFMKDSLPSVCDVGVRWFDFNNSTPAVTNSTVTGDISTYDGLFVPYISLYSAGSLTIREVWLEADPDVDGGEVIPTIDKQVTGDYLADCIKEICTTCAYGWDAYIYNDQIVVTVYAGSDRSYGQSDLPYVVFSESFENLYNTDYQLNTESFANTTLIGGEGEGVERVYTTVGEDNEGLDRFEVFTDVRDVSSNKGSEDEIDAETYLLLLQEKGREKLAELAYTEGFTGEVLSNFVFKYGVDFDLGDLVTVISKYGITRNVRVLSAIESEDETGSKLVPQFNI